ncbi:Zn-ribbon domain-containing OB-fold protein [Mangrovihabitans endophyticus]|uniref:ChsH2 C-terminal OB-fold domain-containing protein n=1 Tax=Mangrovihabitans endophyticus TaxID=1751298 RepID=A0A8J3BT17_9ACTN|nr:OB-fold domain-containing protein [Mangrovihabitans endophyticus]GGK74629.1 hypothetical protein GCM10012284_05720 [Mangrovihabitans endophyticus]
MTQPARPLPSLDEPDTAHFWRATREHRLLYQADPETGDTVYFPRRHGVHTLGAAPRWRESAGLGTVYTVTVIRQHGHPYFRSRTPYAVGFVDLDEGFRMLAEIGGDPDAVRVGQRVRVGWEDHEDLSVPIFQAVEDSRR